MDRSQLTTKRWLRKGSTEHSTIRDLGCSPGRAETGAGGLRVRQADRCRCLPCVSLAAQGRGARCCELAWRNTEVGASKLSKVSIEGVQVQCDDEQGRNGVARSVRRGRCAAFSPVAQNRLSLIAQRPVVSLSMLRNFGNAEGDEEASH
eukprot:1871956-Pleurochrysis_carterae.AAC.1